ncbi:SH3 domain-containing protein [Neptunomonas antarctica]|uniref:SH3 domain-containing protein n=1 Tax=Neptunomonas antarctica TaxID=619304 RepID=UPI0006C79747|nr:SH3 domain-containing protein [Neptunomonas antarctica]
MSNKDSKPDDSMDIINSKKDNSQLVSDSLPKTISPPTNLDSHIIDNVLKANTALDAMKAISLKESLIHKNYSDNARVAAEQAAMFNDNIQRLQQAELSKINYSELFAKIKTPNYSELFAKINTPNYSELFAKIKTPNYSELFAKIKTPNYSELFAKIKTPNYSELFAKIKTPNYSELFAKIKTPNYSELFAKIKTPNYSELFAKIKTPNYSELFAKIKTPNYSELFAKIKTPNYSELFAKIKTPNYSELFAKIKTPNYSELFAKINTPNYSELLAKINTPNYSELFASTSIQNIAFTQQRDFLKLNDLMDQVAGFQNLPDNLHSLIAEARAYSERTASFEEAEHEVAEQSASGRDFSRLSPAIQSLLANLFWFWLNYQLAAISHAELMEHFSIVEHKIEEVINIQNSNQNDLADIKMQLGELKKGQSEIKRSINKVLRNLPTPEKQSIRDYRIVIDSSLHLRSGNGKKYQSLALIPQGAFVRIVSSDNRSWLKVEVSIEGEFLEGWVYRSYTTFPKLPPGQAIVDEFYSITH